MQGAPLSLAFPTQPWKISTNCGTTLNNVYIAVMSEWARFRLKSPASRLFAQPFVQAQIKENIKTPRHWPCEGMPQRASNAENVSIWWRHHVIAVCVCQDFPAVWTQLEIPTRKAFWWIRLSTGSFINETKTWIVCCETLQMHIGRFANECLISWWRHQMETFSALLALCAGNSPVTGEFPAQRPVMRSFDVFFDLCLNKQLSKQSWGWWSETPPSSLLRHCNVMHLWWCACTHRLTK